MTKIKRVVFTHESAMLRKITGETEFPPSETSQGEAHTVQDLFMRAVKTGQLQLNERQAIYRDVESLQEIDSFYRQGLDLTDIDNAKDQILGIKKAADQAIKDLKEIEKNSKQNDENATKNDSTKNDAKNDENLE